MRNRIAVVAITAAVVVAGGFLSTAPVITDEVNTNQTVAKARPRFSVELVSDQQNPMDYEPGASIPVNMRIRNDGSQDATVFVKISVPEVKGVELSDGSTATDVLLYEPGDGWEMVKADGNTKVYAYEKDLAPDEETKPLVEEWCVPDFILTNTDDDLLTGSTSMTEVLQASNQLSCQGYGLMTGIKGTVEQKWNMLGQDG